MGAGHRTVHVRSTKYQVHHQRFDVGVISSGVCSGEHRTWNLKPGTLRQPTVRRYTRTDNGTKTSRMPIAQASDSRT